MTDLPDFTPDCARCAGLCCVAYAFDRSAEFGHDKAANEVCHNLADGYGCQIHERLQGSGYAGCVRFDCHGAGQRTVQQVFGGLGWRQTPAIFEEMMTAFRKLRRAHALLEMLATAERLDLDRPSEALRQTLIGELSPEPDWTRTSLAAFDIDTADARVSGFLKSLALRLRGAR